MKINSMLVLCSFGLPLAASAATVSDVLVRQQWPWNARVNVDYRLATDANEACDIDVSVVDANCVTTAISRAHLTGDVDSVVGGERRIVWDPVASGFSGVAASVRIVLTPKAAIGRKYMVVDLSGAAQNGDNVPYPVSYLDDVPAGGWTDAYKTSKIVLRRIPAGKFKMGSPETEFGRTTGMSESQHTVTLTKDFYIGVFPVTEKQWKSVTGDSRTFWGNTDVSMICNVSWEEIRGSNIEDNWPVSSAVAPDSFIGKLRNRATGTMPTGYVFDLPTEAQWEYACRAGTTTAWNNGTDISVDADGRDVNLDLLGVYVVNPNADGSAGYPTAAFPTVGTKLPNNWGLYDMHGGILEWCTDYYKADITAFVTDPKGPDSHPTENRILRGGGWRYAAKYCRSAWRTSQEPTSAKLARSREGFRLTMMLEVVKE